MGRHHTPPSIRRARLLAGRRFMQPTRRPPTQQRQSCEATRWSAFHAANQACTHPAGEPPTCPSACQPTTYPPSKQAGQPFTRPATRSLERKVASKLSALHQLSSKQGDPTANQPAGQLDSRLVIRAARRSASQRGDPTAGQ
eukprot:366450-Chlamydomonas_euryale.AAC.21